MDAARPRSRQPASMALPMRPQPTRRIEGIVTAGPFFSRQFLNLPNLLLQRHVWSARRFVPAQVRPVICQPVFIQTNFGREPAKVVFTVQGLVFVADVDDFLSWANAPFFRIKSSIAKITSPSTALFFAFKAIAA